MPTATCVEREREKKKKQQRQRQKVKASVKSCLLSNKPSLKSKEHAREGESGRAGKSDRLEITTNSHTYTYTERQTRTHTERERYTDYWVPCCRLA